MNSKYRQLIEQMIRPSLYKREKAQCEDCETEDVEECDKVITAQPRGTKIRKVIVDDSKTTE